MSIISTTMCYPSPAAPTHGVFVRRRLREIHRLMPLKVVAPVPWFPFLRRMGFDPRCGVEPVSTPPRRRCHKDEPPVWRPRMFYLPGVLKSLDGRFYARAFERSLAWAMKDGRTRQLPCLHGRSPDRHVPVKTCLPATSSRESMAPEPVPSPPRRRCHNRNQIRLIDAHFAYPDGVGAWRVASKLGVPFVCTIRGKLVSQIADRLKRRQIREMLLGADALIAVSQSLADLADEVAGRALGVRVIPNGVDTQVFRRFEEVDSTCRQAASGTPMRITCREGIHDTSEDARTACGSSEDARYVVSVGHLQELKGFHRLVEVWPEVRRRVGDVRLVLVGGEAGEPGYERRLRRQVRAAGLGPALAARGKRENAGSETPMPPGNTGGTSMLPVKTTGETPVPQLWPVPQACHRLLGEDGVVALTGRVEPKRVAAMLNAADLFVLASRSEGWCNAIAEALACGCPVVATDVGGNREIVNDPALGRLVPLGDREALTEAICRALTRDWDGCRIAEMGGRRDWQQVARECVDVFESVL